jgi:5-methylcytosine-specific restriction endonuclease McrA
VSQTKHQRWLAKPGNRDKTRAAADRYRKAHPEYVWRWNRANHNRRRGAELEEEAQAFSPVLLRDPCSYCDGTAESLDHIVPIADGGTSDVENLTGACVSCNGRKSDRPLLLFLLEAS